MNRKNEQTGSSNHGNMRDPETLQSQAAGRDAKQLSRQQTPGASQRKQVQGRSGQDADPYERNVPGPTNRSALGGDQSTKR